MKKTLKNNNGITLIALVITIMVLLILAGVAIATLTGENGLLNKASSSVEATIKAERFEKTKELISARYADYLLNGKGTFSNFLIDSLNDEEWINSIEIKEENEKIGLYIETIDGYEMKILVDNSKTSAQIDESYYLKINYDAKITYDKNTEDAQGIMNDQPARIGHKIHLRNNVYKRAGYAFVGWSLTTNGEIIEENELNVTEDVTVFAIWVESYTISFDGNGSDNMMESYEVIKGRITTLPANTFRRNGYIFTGWKVGTTSYTDRQEVTVNSNMTFVAQWIEGHVVILDANNGSGATNKIEVPSNTTITLPNNTFTNGDLNFYKWNTQADGNGTEYADGASIKPTDDMTLYVQWIKMLRGDDLLSVVKDNTFENDKIYYAAVNNQIYSMHVYNYDENLTISEPTSFGGPNDIGTASSYAKNMVVVKVNGDLTVNAKITTYGTSNGGPKGMLIYCTGMLTNNSEISMTARGAYAEGQDVYLFKNKNPIEDQNQYEYIPATTNNGSTRLGTKGGNGSNRSLGGGGTGGSYSSPNTYTSGGIGGNSTSYSGGAGGGDSYNNTSSSNRGSSIGGAGGNANGGGGGGAGNPGGTANGKSQSGENGTGGLLIIFANRLEKAGTITSNGSKGGYALTKYPNYSYGGRRRRLWCWIN